MIVKDEKKLSFQATFARHRMNLAEKFDCILRSHGIVQYFRPVQTELSKGQESNFLYGQGTSVGTGHLNARIFNGQKLVWCRVNVALGNRPFNGFFFNF